MVSLIASQNLLSSLIGAVSALLFIVGDYFLTDLCLWFDVLRSDQIKQQSQSTTSTHLIVSPLFSAQPSKKQR
jgi:hypothetical protein